MVSGTSTQIYQLLTATAGLDLSWRSSFLRYTSLWTRSKNIRQSECINGEKTAAGTESLREEGSTSAFLFFKNCFNLLRRGKE